MTALLETRDLNKRFGGLHVTNDVNFALEQGEIHCLIGPNGAGKSTLFRLILGEHPPSSGAIFYAGEDITAPEAIPAHPHAASASSSRCRASSRR